MRSSAGRIVLGVIAVAAACAVPAVVAEERAAQQAGTARTARKLAIVVPAGEAATRVPAFSRFEVSFTIDGTRATMLHWPYDPAPPHGIPAGAGITVAGVFTDPGGREYRQPAFYYQDFKREVRNGRDWQYPTSTFTWKVRFSPNQPGTWKYRIVAQDRSGTAETESRSFAVIPSSNHGFVRVAKADPRYFEFDDGSFFSGLGLQLPEFLEDPVTRGEPIYRALQANGINFVRLWISSLYGSAWTPYVGGRNRYSGYLPMAGLMPFRDDTTGEATLTTRIDYEPTGDAGWFDGCRLEAFDDPEAVKPNTRYRVRATYVGRRISGPRNPRSAKYGFVVKLGGMFPNCYEPGTSRAVTSYGGNTTTWGTVEGEWFSGNRSFLPKLHLAMENATQGQAFVRSVSIREILPGGGEGPEILARPSLEYEQYIPQARAFALDTIVGLAERHGVYLKLVVLEKGDEVYTKMDDNGEFVTSRDNPDGVYGTGRVVNKTRWLQQAWWRYLQARWGYSPNIHSWELLNEGDPASTRHFELADEFGKYMHYGVFGARPGTAFDHPNDHLVTTSFWHSFPAAEFWANRQYPHIDYADLHAYVSTTFAPRADKEKMMQDAAYYHTWHSQFVAAAHVGKPVVRGEAGLDVPGRQDELALGVQRDREGVWLHNFLWAGLDAGALYELYWWRSHIWNREVDHRGEYRLVNQFLAGLRLNEGGYRPWNGKVSTTALRVVGQKNPAAGTMHLWVQNVNHTWKRVMNGDAIAPVSGEITVDGFRPGAAYQVEWWDTHAAGKSILDTRQLSASASGVLTIPVTSLQTDVALQVSPYKTQLSSAPESSEKE